MGFGVGGTVGGVVGGGSGVLVARGRGLGVSVGIGTGVGVAVGGEQAGTLPETIVSWVTDRGAVCWLSIVAEFVRIVPSPSPQGTVTLITICPETPGARVPTSQCHALPSPPLGRGDALTKRTLLSRTSVTTTPDARVSPVLL